MFCAKISKGFDHLSQDCFCFGCSLHSHFPFDFHPPVDKINQHNLHL